MSAQDVIQTVAIMLGVGLVSKLIADLARLPQMLVLLGAGALIGPAALDAIDVPLDSLGAQLVLTVGVSFILFHGGLQLSARVLEREGLRANGRLTGDHRFVASDAPEQFLRMGQRFLGATIDRVETVTLG